MPNSEWDSATTDKKLEMLRDDIGKIFDYLNRIIHDVGSAHQTGRANDALLKEVAKAVEAIEKQLPKAAKKK
jgi:hypothetical protein